MLTTVPSQDGPHFEISSSHVCPPVMTKSRKILPFSHIFLHPNPDLSVNRFQLLLLPVLRFQGDHCLLSMWDLRRLLAPVGQTF